MQAQETRHKGIAVAKAEIERRGGRIYQATNARSANELRLSLPDGGSADVYVKTRGSGTWQTDIRKGSPAKPADERRFWLFVDINAQPTAFYVAPASWVENDIYETYQADLARFGGSRPRSPGSTHHGISEGRIAEWRDRWDLLGLDI